MTSIYADSHENRQITEQLNNLVEMLEAPNITHDLYNFVYRNFCAAREHRMRTGVDTEMMRSLRAYKSRYDPEDLELLDNKSDVYMGITNLKCRAFQSWVSDIILNAEDQPWTLKSTPVPELPQRLEDILVNRLTLEFQNLGFEESGFQGSFEDIAASAKTLALEHAQQMADDANMGMEEKIADQLLEGSWRETFEEFIVDLSVFPSAVIKGPFLRPRRVMTTRGGVPREITEMRMETARINPFDVFPAPNAKCTQSGQFVSYVDRMSQDELFKCIGVYGFDEVAIRQTLSCNPNGTQDWTNTSSGEREMLERKNDDERAPDQRYHVVVYHGKIPGSFLIDRGLSVEDPHEHIEAEIWICSGRILRAITNPYPLGARPIHAVPYQPEPGSFWGRSLPSLLRDVQRVGNASARALVKNMGYSAGPFGEYDENRLVHEDDIETMAPFRMLAVKRDPYGNGGNAIRFAKIDNVSQGLIAVFDRFGREADDVSGIPAYALGTPQTSGAGRTLGGLSLLLGNAAKGIKRVIGLVDKRAIEPIIELYYNLNLLYSEDETIKADAQVVARGSVGLLQRELSQARATEVLQIITPYAQTGLVPPESIQIVLRDVLRSLGYAADELIPDPSRDDRLAAALAGFANGTQPGLGVGPGVGPQPIPPNLSPAAPGTPIPDLDGRSQVPADPGDLESLPLPI